MALDNRDFSDQDTLVTSAFGDSGERSWSWTPEPVRLESAPAAQFTPTRFDVVTASFQFPCSLIDARAQALVEHALREGERHSMSLWRAALRESIERTSRDTAHTPDNATCAALFWDRVGDDYRVAVTFELPMRPTARSARH